MQFEPAKPAALADWAYNTIKEAILRLQLLPGAQLRIEDLADQMGISRTPIREALLRLEGDGLVRTVPRVGFFVTEVTRADLKELFELREVLESYAAGKAAALLSEQDLARIDRMLEASMSAVERGDLDEFLQTEIDFHRSLTEHAENRRLVTMMESVRDLTHRERRLSVRSTENVRQSLEEHNRIARALHRRDSELAARLMAEHIRAARDRLLHFLDLPQGPAGPQQN